MTFNLTVSSSPRASLKVFRVSVHFPADKALEIIQDQVFIRLYFLISQDDSEIDSGSIDRRLLHLFFVSLAQQVEVTIQEFCRLFNIFPVSLLVVKKTKLESSFSLRCFITFLKSDVEHFKQMLNGLTDVASF